MNNLAMPAERERTPLPKSAFWAGVFRNSAIGLLGILILMFLSAPFIEDLPGGEMIEASLVTLIMGFAVLAVGGRRQTLMIALLLVTPTLGGKWANHFSPGIVSSVVYLFAATIFFAFVVAQLVQFVLRAPHVNTNVLSAGISGYLLLGLIWVPAYLLVARLNPGAFNLPAGGIMDGFNAFYFSFTTLCTVGYGDFTPASKGARMLAILEAITGLFYVAVLISRLVAVYSTDPPTRSASDDSAT